MKKSVALKRSELTLLLVLLVQLCVVTVGISVERDALQNLLDRSESAVEGEALESLVEDLRNNPIVLDRADAYALRRLPWLSSADVLALDAFRRRGGHFTSPLVLQRLIGKEKTAFILPYVRLARKRRRKRVRRKKSVGVRGSLYSRLYWETPPREGILNGNYAGTNARLYHKAQFSAPHLGVGMVQEKDVGEDDYADYTSFALDLNDWGVLDRAVIGNYKVSIAQGLVVGQGRFGSKGSDPVGGTRLTSRQLVPHLSSSETGFMHGIGVALRSDPLDLLAFYSSRQADAIIDGDGVMTSMPVSGYHRTVLERSRKNNITETVQGAHLQLHTRVGEVAVRTGGTMVGCSYPYPYDSFGSVDGQYPYSSASWYGVDADVASGPFSIFAETACSVHPADQSWLVGAEYELWPGFSTVFGRRHYGALYFSQFASAFAERGDGASDEEAYYVGLHFETDKGFSVGGYCDLFNFPVLGSHCPVASSGVDARVMTNWRMQPWLSWNLQVQHKYKEEEHNDGTSSLPLWYALPLETDRVQLNCMLNLSSSLRTKSRGELKHVCKHFLAGDESFRGALFFQQIGYYGNGFSLKGRYTRFVTTDHDAALYAYEDDLPFTSGLGSYQGDGSSFFVVATWQALQAMKLAARFETTWYGDRSVYGSGNDERATNAPGTFHVGCLMTF